MPYLKVLGILLRLDVVVLQLGHLLGLLARHLLLVRERVRELRNFNLLVHLDLMLRVQILLQLRDFRLHFRDGVLRRRKVPVKRGDLLRELGELGLALREGLLVRVDKELVKFLVANELTDLEGVAMIAETASRPRAATSVTTVASSKIANAGLDCARPGSRLPGAVCRDEPANGSKKSAIAVAS